MDKIEIYHYLKRQNIAYEITEHKAVFNMEEADAVDLIVETINYKDSIIKVHHFKNFPMYLNPRKCYCCNKDIESDED